MTYNCHAAHPHAVDFAWLRDNPGQLFNTDTNCAEREQMLAGQRNRSCEQNCYPAEDRGQVSTRMIESTPDRRFIEIHTQPKTVDATLFSDCNLGCSYCCKEYSTTWQRDLVQHGAYELPGFWDQDRYSINAKDRLAQKFSQREKQNLDRVQMLIRELELMKGNLETLIISGGEPLLNNHLVDVVRSAADVPTIYLFTGLGVNFDRFQRLLDQLKQFPNLVLYISAENTGALYEFNRHGAAWADFNKRVQAIRESGIRFEFRASISNLTVTGLADFMDFAGSDTVQINFVHHPRFMSVGNLDHKTKQTVLDRLQSWQHRPQMQQVIESLQSQDHTEQDRVWLRDWLTQFAQRRSIDLHCFEPSFLKWLQL
jgi:MoaA/NifB/PqqE/SkfB family radical SAM enzyme